MGKLECRLKVLETGKVEKSPFKKDARKSAGAFAVKSETMEYDEAADSTLKRKKEEPEVKEEAKEEAEEAEAPPKKKKKKDKKVKEEATPEAEEEITAEVESAEPE